jgi:hypothetical protein
MKTAVIIPWRQGETELQATIDSATQSIAKGAILPVEDKAGDGPAITRHRGIEAATGADVIVLVDAHMIFDGPVLSDMARAVRKSGGLLCAKCYHNEACTWEGQPAYYTGADIHYTGEDQNGRQALVWKWSSDPKPGPRTCVGGACYVFRRDWYYQTGQCLSALPAWGCDEEALSITAWLSGHMPEVFDGRVAHRYRRSPPWKAAARPILTSRAAMISAVASDPIDRAALLAYQGAKEDTRVEVARWRDALLKLPRTWEQWKAEVPIMPKKEEPKQQPKAVKKAARSMGRANYGATENGRACKCGCDGSRIDSMRQAGRMIVRYRVCLECGRRRTTQQIVESL